MNLSFNEHTHSEDEDMPAEVDFSGGERGRYSHLFGEVTADEDSIAGLLKERGLNAERFEDSASRKSRLPDFQLFRHSRLIGFCEVKTLTQQSINGETEVEPVSQETAEFRSVSNAVYSAARSLAKANPTHGLLNVLALVAVHGVADIKVLERVISGEWNPLTGTRESAPSAIVERMRAIDLYLWIEHSRRGPLEVLAQFSRNGTRGAVADEFIALKTDKARSIA